MAFANFGILQAMPDPYERIRQASQGWGALPGVVGGIRQQMDEERKAKEAAYNQQKKAELSQKILAEWDSPDDGEIFKAADTQPVRFRKAAMFLSPYDPKLSESMLMQADERDRFEKQLLDQTARAEAKIPNETFIRMKDAYDVTRNAYNDADANLQRYMKSNPDDITGITALRNVLTEEGKKLNDLRVTLAEKSKGTQWEGAYNFTSPAPDGNAPAPQVAPQVVPQVEVAPIVLKTSADLPTAKREIAKRVQAGALSTDGAAREIADLEYQAGELRKTEGAAAGAKAKAEAEEQKRVGVLVGSAKTLGENSIMMGAVDKVASGQLDDLSVKAMLSSLPVENARTISGIGEKDETLLNTLRKKIGTDTEYTESDRAALVDIAKNIKMGYEKKVKAIQDNWDKLTPAQQAQITTDFPAFAPKSAQQSTKGDPLGIRR